MRLEGGRAGGREGGIPLLSWHAKKSLKLPQKESHVELEYTRVDSQSLSLSVSELS